MAKAATATAPALEQRPGTYIAMASDKSAGKSTIGNVIADMLRASSKTVHLYDPDKTNGALLKRHGTRDENKNLLREQDPAKGVGYYALAKERSRDMFVNCLDVNPLPDIVFADMGAKSLDNLKQIVDRGNGVKGLIDVINGQGFNMTLVHVISNLSDTTASVRAYLDVFGDRVNHIAVINEYHGTKVGPLNKPSTDPAARANWGETDFPFWFGHYDPDKGQDTGYKTRDEFLAMGGTEVLFPELSKRVYARLVATTLTFKGAETAKAFVLSDKSNIKRFNEEAQAAFEPVKHLLGLD